MPYHSTPTPLLPNSQDLYSPKEVSALLRIPLSGVEAMLENGQLRYLRIADTVIIPKTFLEEFLASQEVPRYNAKQEPIFPQEAQGGVNSPLRFGKQRAFFEPCQLYNLA